MRDTRAQAEVGIDDPSFRNVDPLAQLSPWIDVVPGHVSAALEPSLDRFDERRVRVFRPSWGKRRIDIDVRQAPRNQVTVFFTLDGRTAQAVPAEAFDHELIRALLPMRDFARRLQQHNKSVATWLHTMGHSVGAESHHERTFMTLADFHPAITLIAGQPFTLAWHTQQGLQTHTPDVLVVGNRPQPLIVDVRSKYGAQDPKWLAKVPRIEAAMEALGVGYMIWTGMSRPFRRNLENFTEARVPRTSYEKWSPTARELARDPLPVTALADLLDGAGYQRVWALTLIRRMLWRHALRVDMFQPFKLHSIVERGYA